MLGPRGSETNVNECGCVGSAAAAESCARPRRGDVHMSCSRVQRDVAVDVWFTLLFTIFYSVYYCGERLSDCLWGTVEGTAGRPPPRCFPPSRPPLACGLQRHHSESSLRTAFWLQSALRPRSSSTTAANHPAPSAPEQPRSAEPTRENALLCRFVARSCARHAGRRLHSARQCVGPGRAPPGRVSRGLDARAHCRDQIVVGGLSRSRGVRAGAARGPADRGLCASLRGRRRAAPPPGPRLRRRAARIPHRLGGGGCDRADPVARGPNVLEALRRDG